VRQKSFQLCLSVFISLLLSNAASADEKKGPAIDPSGPRDVFLKKSGGTGAVTVDFDCGNGKQQSQYCLIHLDDQENGVVCYGLVSTDKVVNPNINCVAVGHKPKK